MKANAILAGIGFTAKDFGQVKPLDTGELVRTERQFCEGCTGYPCKKTRFKGSVPQIFFDEDGNPKIQAVECEVYEQFNRQRALERKFKNARIPRRYLGKTLEDYRADELNRNAVEFAKRILTDKFSGAFFCGEVGTGKTFLAALIAQDFIKAGRTVLFENVADLLTEFYEVFRGKSDVTEQELLRELYEVDLLILDDFGLEKPTQFVGATLCKILDARYNREGAVTIVTSNHTPSQIKWRLNNPTDATDEFCLNGTRIYDRLIEICKTVNFKGTSRRV